MTENDLSKIIILKKDQVSEIRQQYYDFANAGINIRALWSAWYYYFFESEGTGSIIEKIQNNKGTYWEWFTELSWRYPHKVDINVFDKVIPYQLSTMPLVDTHFLSKFILFFLERFDEDQERLSYYNKVKENLSNIDYSINFEPDGIKISEIRNFVKKVIEDRITTIESAEIYARIQKDLFNDGEESLFEKPTQEKLTYEFISLLKIFSDSVDINTLVLEYYRGFEGEFPAIENIDEAAKEIAEVHRQEMEQVLRETGMIIDDEVNPATEIKTDPVQSVDYKSLQTQLIRANKKDKSGDFINIERVFAKMMEMAREYNDPKINELYYFDDASRSFRWNEEMLGEDANKIK